MMKLKCCWLLAAVVSASCVGAAGQGAESPRDTIQLRDVSSDGSDVLVEMGRLEKTPVERSSRLIVLDGRTLKPQLKLARLFGDSTWDASLSPDGRLLAVAAERVKSFKSLGAFWQLWDVASGQMVRQGRTARGMMSQVLFSPDGRTLALVNGKMAGRYGWVKVFLVDVASGRTLRELRAPMTYAQLSFSDDGRYLAALGDVRLGRVIPYPAPGAIQGRGVLWEAATGEELALWKFPNAILRGLRFVPGASGSPLRVVSDRQAWSQDPVFARRGSKGLVRLVSGQSGRKTLCSRGSATSSPRS